jgi:hypothetical protein
MGNFSYNGKFFLQWEIFLTMGNFFYNGKFFLHWEIFLTMGNFSYNGKYFAQSFWRKSKLTFYDQ